VITNFEQLDLNQTYSYADYLLWRFDERVELLKGRIMKMSPAPNRIHQKIVSFLNGEFHTFFKLSKCEVYPSPFDVRLPVSTDLSISKKYKSKAKSLPDGKMMTVVQPDICVVCNTDILDDRGCVGAPDITIEILSPGNTKIEMKDKFEIYQEAGVKEYWIFEPQDQFVIIYTLIKGIFVGSRPYTIGHNISSYILPDFCINVDQLFG
jgi:Uma2 family endonuclease